MAEIRPATAGSKKAGRLLLASLAAMTCISAALGPTAALGGSARGDVTPAQLPGLLSHAGDFITDPSGRVVQLHGTMIYSKEEGYFDSRFSEQDARFLASEGFNFVRVNWAWQMAEPQPGVFDSSYYGRFRDLNEMLAGYGIYALFGPSNNSYAEKYGGHGAPEWAAIDRFCDPSTNAVTCTSPVVAGPAEYDAWENFYADAPAPDGTGVLSHLEQAVQGMATTMKNQPNVLGYDPLHEAPPTSVPGCVKYQPCPPFEMINLPPIYRRLIEAVRAADENHLIFYEPLSMTVSPEFWTGVHLPAPLSDDPGLGVNFHHTYRDCAIVAPPDQVCRASEAAALDAADDYAQRAGAAKLLCGFGNSILDEEHARVVELAGARFISWCNYTYRAPEDEQSFQNGIIIDNDRPGSQDNARQGRLDALVVPYPQLTAGTPQTYAFDRNSKVMTFTYSTQAAGPTMPCPQATTEIFIPHRVYPDGYTMEVTGARVVSGPTSAWLDLETLPGASSVSVSVSPTTGSSTDVPETAWGPAAAVRCADGAQDSETK